MPSPFSFLNTDTIQVEVPTEVTGLGETINLLPKQIKARVILKQGLIRSKNNELVDYQGKLRYDHNVHDVPIGSVITHNDIKYKVISYKETGGLPGVPKERVAILKWLI